MKKIFQNIILLSICVLGTLSCSDSDFDLKNLVPEQYHKVLYFKNDGVSTLSLSTTQTNYKDSVLIIKAGSDPSLTANVNVRVLSQSEVDAAYPNAHYKVLPNNVYSIDDDTNVSFASNERSRFLHYTVHADQVYKAKTNPEDVMILPFMLTSDNDTINPNKNSALYKMDVRIPVISIDGSSDESMIYKKIDFSINATLSYIDINKWDVTSDISVPSNAAELVQGYNTANNVNYELLPVKNCTLPKNFLFSKGSFKSTANVSISRTGLVSDKNYILPIQLANTSMGDQMQASKAISYIVLHNPKYGYEIADRSKWKVVFCNEDGKHTSVGSPLGDGAPAMIDNNPSTNWFYARPNDYNTDFADSDDYDYNFKDYHAFFGDRKVSGKQAAVIDMNEVKNIVGIGIQAAYTSTFNDCHLINCSFSVSNDSEFKFIPLKNGGNIDDYTNLSLNNWTSIFTWSNMPQDNNMNWKDVENDVKSLGGVKGRFLKINPLKGTYGGSNQGFRISEIMIKHLVAIDGEAIK